ncbi:hypothetical protein DP643_27060 [Salmonella enterica]|nr:hypothetical protein [Salmonella enterica]EBN8268567.1 hypothetical protein [Salmonella enterica]EBR3715325.1 hypothetical protein [Salmonella enterica]EBV0538240.1 hypothetical protein [Salmonella enterica subsp. enterica serovar Glostrup]EDX6794170.1 hypothetical protein [Salmonella enterica subsp. enterica serovar Sandiego]
MTVVIFRSYSHLASAKSDVGIGVPESSKRITALSGFFMREAQSHSHYGGLCGGTDRFTGFLT